MARVWESALAAKGLLWGIQNALIQEFRDRIEAAQNAFDQAAPAVRTAALTESINEAFDRLEALMRYLKDRYFRKPPLFDEDFESLLLAPNDSAAPEAPRPGSRVIITLYYKGRNTVVVDANPMPGDSPPEDCYMEVFRGVMLPPARFEGAPAGQEREGGKAGLRPCFMRSPSSGNELFKWLNTSRKQEFAYFRPEDQGKVAYFCARYVNEKGEAGPWGPVAAIIIPQGDDASLA
jgi:hypothetical protein